MLTTFLRVFLVSHFLFACVTSGNQAKLVVRIYANLAEIIHSVDKFPLVFTNDEWHDIRSDSITLLGEDLNVTSQRITEKKNSMNGAQVYIRAPISIDKTSIMLLKATLIDEQRKLVKIQDEVISGNEILYFTVSEEDIFYSEEPLESRFYVDFTYVPSTAKPFVSYLRSNINWQTQYQLNLYDDKSDLIVMANIRNNGKSSLSIDQAELFSGDIKLNMQRQLYDDFNIYESPYSFTTSTTKSRSSFQSVGQSEELMGVHVFAIDEPFIIDAQTNYLLPMFRPHIKVERYHSISKSFSVVSNTGKTKRFYRLKSDQYLSHGNCIVRERERVVGDTVIPNLAAKDKYEFSIGQDAEIIYIENVTLVSSKPVQEDLTLSSIQIRCSTRSVYKIDVEVKNLKTRSVKVEYKQQFYSSQFELIESTDNICTRDGSLIECKITLNANDEQIYSYNIELIDN